MLLATLFIYAYKFLRGSGTGHMVLATLFMLCMEQAASMLTIPLTAAIAWPRHKEEVSTKQNKNVDLLIQVVQIGWNIIYVNEKHQLQSYLIPGIYMFFTIAHCLYIHWLAANYYDKL